MHAAMRCYGVPTHFEMGVEGVERVHPYACVVFYGTWWGIFVKVVGE